MVRLHIWSYGTKFWYSNNLLHRANGPAIILIAGGQLLYWYGQRVTEYEHIMLVAQELING